MNKKATAVTTSASSKPWDLPLYMVSYKSNKKEPADIPELKSTKHVWLNSGQGFAADLNEFASKEDNAWLLIAFAHAHGHAVSSFLQQAASLSSEDVIIATTNTPNSKKTEWLSGFRPSELNTPFLLVNKATLLNLLSSGVDLTQKYTLLYGLEKSSNHWAMVETTASDEQKAMPTLKDKIKAAVSHYNPIKFMQQPARHLFWALALVVLVAMTAMSRDAGISGDEFTQYDWADTAIIPYYTDGKEAALEDNKKLMHLYGSSFDTFTALMARITGTDDVYRLRHFWNSVFGFICIIFSALIIKRLTNSYKWATVGLIALFFTPRLLGDALNNPKDIPFAAGYIMGIYYALRYYGRNGGRLSQAIGLVLGIALAISIRIGGLVLVPTVALYAGIKYIEKIGWKQFASFRWTGFVRFIGGFSVMAFAAFLIGIAPWPYGIEEPFTNPFNALKAFTNFEATLRQLFEGKMMDSGMLPSYYLSKYLLITLPLTALFGLLLYILTMLIKRKFWDESLIILFAAVFPVFYIWLQKSNVYGGMRQILFVVPCLIILAIVGFWLLEKYLQKIKLAKTALPVLALALSAPAAVHTFKNHPLQYVYFNELVGGVKGAYSYYEMDYYLASLRQSSEWLLNNVIRKNPDKKFEVLTYGMDHVKYYMRNDKNVHVGFTRTDERSNKDWDYTIFYNGFTDHDRLSNGSYPPVGTVFTPTVDGKPMGWVVKRPSRADFEGYVALEKTKNYRLAAEKFNEYLKSDNKSSEVWFYLSNAYANLGNLDSAIWAAEKSLAVFPESSKSLFALNSFYGAQQKWDKAAETMQKYLESRPNDPDGWMMLAQSQFGARKLDDAKTSIQKAIAIEPIRNAAYYETGARIMQAMKDDIGMKQYINAMQINSRDPKVQGPALESIQSIYSEITGNDLDLSKYQ